MTTPDVRRALAGVWRIESARIVGALTRMVGDVGRAEDFAQDALVAALERWPGEGLPDNPGAWLMTAARRRAIDHLRRDRRLDRKHEELGRELEARREADGPGPGGWPGEPVDDDVLRLVFLCCHPSLSTEARVALTLRLAGGLTTREIARAFLVPVPTLAQRIVRAKRTLREAEAPFELPGEEELAGRLASVLEVIYLIFNEGYAATEGEEWTRPVLCHEAIRLGRVLAGLAPEEPEVHGLVALMELHASRLGARIGPGGEPVLLADQDRSRWDHLLVRRGLAALERAVELGAAGRSDTPAASGSPSTSGPPSTSGSPAGPCTLQAAIAACHARAPTPEATDWERIAALYGALARVAPSPVVELNRAVAVGRATGAEAGLEIVEALARDGALDGYPYLPAVRGDLLEELGRREEAREAFERAADLTRNEAEREVLLGRAATSRFPTSPTSGVPDVHPGAGGSPMPDHDSFQGIVPCLWFDDEAEEAATFYTGIFPDSTITSVARYPEGFDNPGGKPRGSVMTVELELAGQPFTALNGGPQFTINPTISFFAQTSDVEEAGRIARSLAEGGSYLMELGEYPWSPRYAWVEDRYGASWQVMFSEERGQGPMIFPCLMFAGAVHGRAEEALRLYADVFPGGSIEALERYTADEGPEGTVKHGRLSLGGQRLVAMDSHLEHEARFSEAVSLQVMCEDQSGVDHYWEKLSADGEEGPCGWLKDRFGVSWQVVPTSFVEMMRDGEASGPGYERAFRAMLEMKKLDVGTLEKAYGG